MTGSVRLTARDGVTFTVDTGFLCVDVLYTGGRDERAVWETWHTPDDAARWVAASGAFWGDVETAIDDGDLVRLAELREVLWRTVACLVDGREHDPADVEALNSAAALTVPTPRLYAGRLETAEPVTGDHVLATLARDALHLVAGPYAHRAKRCAADDCAIVFVDTSRPGVRRWCSMARCGNRDKARTRRRSEKS